MKAKLSGFSCCPDLFSETTFPIWKWNVITILFLYNIVIQALPLFYFPEYFDAAQTRHHSFCFDWILSFVLQSKQSLNPNLTFSWWVSAEQPRLGLWQEMPVHGQACVGGLAALQVIHHPSPDQKSFDAFNLNWFFELWVLLRGLNLLLLISISLL